LSHAVEGYLAKGDNPVGDAIALDSIRRVFQWLPRAVQNGSDREARWHMLMASMEAMLVAKGLGAGHALANTFGDQGLHHGTLVTIALPAVLRQLDAHVPERLKQLGEAMGLERGRQGVSGLATPLQRARDDTGHPEWGEARRQRPDLLHAGLVEVDAGSPA
jgi:alcohol dehydrogenase class IV